MLSLFRNNQYSSILFLFLYAGLLRLPALLGFADFEPKRFCSEAGVWGVWICQTLENQSFVSALLALVAVVIQAVLINSIDATHRIANDRTWIPAVFYILVASSISEFLFLSPALLGVTFLIPAFRLIFSTYKEKSITGLVFDATFWVSVGSLFYPPILLLLLPTLLGLLMLRPQGLRGFLVAFSGFFVPYFLYWLWLFWNGEASVFWEKQFGHLFGFIQFKAEWTVKTIAKLLFLGFLAAVVVLNYGSYFHKKLIQVQKFIGIFYWFLVIAAVGMVFKNPLHPEYFLLMAPTLGFLLGLTFSNIKNRGLAEVLHLMLVGLIFFIQFSPF